MSSRAASTASASTSGIPTEEHAELRGHEGPVLAVRFNRDGRYLLTCGKDRTFRLWNPYKATLIKTYGGHAHEVRDVAAAADNSRLATCGGDKQVFLWDVTTGQKIRRFRGHDSAVNAVRFAADDALCVSAGYDRSVRVFDVRSNACDPIQTIAAFRDAVTSLAVSDTKIIAGSVDGTVRTFDVRAGRTHADDVGRPVVSVAISGDGQCVLAGLLGSRVALLDAEDGDVLAEYRGGHVAETTRVDARLTNDDARVAAASEDGKVYFYELVDAGVDAVVDAHPRGATCGLDWHPTACVMATSSTDGTAKVWVPPGGRGVEKYLAPAS